jgi:vacuolar protein-sorting-associated protein 4
VTEAVKYDNEENFEKAFECYMRALEQFQLHCKYDKNATSRDMIQNKMREYMSRAEYLKTVINSRTRTDHAGDASTAVGQKKKPAVRAPARACLLCASAACAARL